MKQYLIVVTLLLEHDGWRSSYHMPTWILDSVIQGIVGIDHAKVIARDMMNNLTAGRKDIREILIDVSEGRDYTNA